MSAALSGAVDLSALKARAEATRNQPAGGPPGQAPPAGGGGAAFDVTEANLQSAVLERSLQQLVVVAIGTARSPQSEQFTAQLARLAEQSGGAWVLAKVDAETEPAVAQTFAQAVGAQTIPLVLAIAGGRPIDAFQGALPEPEIRKWLNSLLDALRDKLPGVQNAQPAEAEEQPEDPRFTEAENALERGDYAAAEAAYQRILDVEPANELAKAALAQVKFAERADKADPSAVQRAEADPSDLEAQFAAADFEVAQNQVEEAFARLIAAVRRTAGDERNRVREHLVALFELFDPADDRVAKARRDLASALF